MESDYRYYNQNATVNSGCFTENTITFLDKDFEPLDKIQVYPNPMTDKFTLNGEIDYPTEIIFLDSFGRVLKHVTLQNNSQRVNISDLLSGVYSLQLKGNQTIRILSSSSKCNFRFKARMVLD